MFHRKIVHIRSTKLTFQKLCRYISSAQLSNLLRPFYFVVHPDLFGKHPDQRKINEESLKHLSSHIESLQKHKYSSAPQFLSFYIREGDSRDKFKLIKIRMERSAGLNKFIRHILETCNLPLNNIEKIQKDNTNKQTQYRPGNAESHSRDPASSFVNDVVFGTAEFEFLHKKTRKTMQELTLREWLIDNRKCAIERLDALKDMKEEVDKLQKRLVKQLQLKDLQYDCGWNIEHHRGCLKCLERLANTHKKQMENLKGRIVVFAQKSGVSLDGHVMFYTGDVQYNWLEFIRNISIQDEYRKKVPSYELTLSQVLRNIVVTQRKFMPKAQVVNYASHLRKLTTTLLDYLTTHSFPKSWPDNLERFEIVVESESGPLMISPTGQIIVPAACPGSIFVDFMTNHMKEASEKADEYKVNKYIEKELHRKCKEQLQLQELVKDDSIDPIKMIYCLENLLNTNIKIDRCTLLITHYYSILSDGTVCIPWDFTLD